MSGGTDARGSRVMAAMSRERLRAGEAPGDFPGRRRIRAAMVVSLSKAAGTRHGNASGGPAAPARFVWVVCPRRRVVVCRSPVEVRVLTEADELDGGEWLPGLRIRVAELFRS